MAIGQRKRDIRYAHQSDSLTNATIRIGGEDYLAQIAIRPSTVTIYNVTVVDYNWTPIAIGLTGVLAYKMSEEDGQPFHYCFDGIGTTYMTARSPIQRDTEITAIYVKRTGTTTLKMQLEIWSI